MDVDDPVVDLVRTAGDDLEQLVAAEDRAGAPGERREQPDLAGREAAARQATRSPARASVKRRLAGSTTRRPASKDSGGSSIGAVAPRSRVRRPRSAARLRRRIAATRAVSSCGLNGLAR